MQLLSKNIVGALLILMMLAFLYTSLMGAFKEVKEISLSDLVGKINGGEVIKIVVRDSDLDITLKDNTELKSKKENEAALSETFKNYGVAEDKLRAVALGVENPDGALYWVGVSLPFLLPFLLIVAFFWLTARQVQRANIQAFTFGQSRARIIYPNNAKERVLFKDVAGAKEAKEELVEIVDFLKSPKKFLDIGARIPKGVLLMGAPGTGKTMLAKAVAGEAGVPFFHMSASEFVEMFVGVGASRVRDLFKMAKKSAPAIIFIDEIDAVGRHRGAGLGGGHDEREQTLNQILVELDGFETNESVIVMAATNRPDVLDPALLRPGRFDRRVILDLPDINDREDILKIHSKTKPLDDSVNLRRIAERTPGFSGADLANLVNESAILAARENRKQVMQLDLINSIEKVLLGPERRSHILSDDEKKISAYHEAGHALVAASLPEVDPVHKISIIARGRAAGFTMKLPTEDRHLYSKTHFLSELAVSLGGYAAELVSFGELTTGASDDLKKATDLARALVTKYGMSEKVGPLAFGGREDYVFLGKDFSATNDYSETLATLIDSEVSAFMKNALKRAKDILTRHKKSLDALAQKLIKEETVERDEFTKFIHAHGVA
ncbi:MAG: ATP-dependent zinc metalloprotease FtsH [Candidatus Giovannonibacteria bacterium GW2011_GWA1_43_15]|uniref:ATP-dependent zinc metalloprotease FtsH n=1 Tax=Candidatus Giovannonibacteria bacterium RIFCSPLOWO2_12_FULL_43_26 TaxID=1798363 RepID=A0A1F5XUY3_9BACT|nr:MAG: ATP-dependent zinc metalloprotease FtsH [Candidatus Giovannonibacteria bacterium GW2011_GWB1_43_13]KKS99937.1 MAG: ATP-dependent zinc metalloprotease FtsH [Candidatus Giovannonibacteria bacterium GW2011_GWA1_43_15]OGF58901.1 MAG: cell division protein FtsH [Candidatus Giovannonibacteria bacterium RIFCSPHIGHO2_01_FULL_43_140]OGF70061.1 MAG: cell division protein FtsH [Candidatus Giovannonibacteria bacterium RIFCSPHIGHO2_02_FULL_44_51]OGF72074.1 MAG: cell division protein FtsH [Candidatus